MSTVLIELTNPKAIDLLRDLEAMQIIRLVYGEEKPAQSLSERFTGKLTAEEGRALKQQIAESRNEWERPI